MRLFEGLVKTNREEFYTELEAVAGRLGIPSHWLEFCIWFETAKTMDHTIQSSKTKATGLIQFMPLTAKSLGTTVDALKEMTNVQQLKYVEKYLWPYRNRFKSFTDVYLTIFFPVAVGRPDSFIIEAGRLKASVIAKQNPVFDINEDGQITKAEIKERLLGLLPKEYRKEFI